MKQPSLSGCRECFEIQCVSTGQWKDNCITGDQQVSVIVQITDSCPECEEDHFDIQALTYSKVGPS